MRLSRRGVRTSARLDAKRAPSASRTAAIVDEPLTQGDGFGRTIQSGSSAGESAAQSPTLNQSRAFQNQFDYINDEVIAPAFGVRLQTAMLTFSRRVSDGGSFASHCWSEERGGSLHEVALHPAWVKECLPVETSGTILHQMIHGWQHHHGSLGRRGYHNGEWAMAMEKVGLTPTATGAPGGARTGQSVRQYVVPGGLFETAFARMPADYYLPWSGIGAATNPSVRNKATYACPGCKVRVWGKPGLGIDCQSCKVAFVIGP